MKRRLSTAVLAIACMIALGACGSDDPAPSASGPEGDGSEASSNAVEISGFAYLPADLTVSVGDTVEWTNQDDIEHTVTSGKGQEQGVPGVSNDKAARPDGVFNGTMEQKGDTFSFTFDEAGSFDYFCAIHPGMRASIVVE